MMTKQQLFSDARFSFDRGDYFSAFQTLGKLGVQEFLFYATKTIKTKQVRKVNWLTHSPSAIYFWNEYILNDDVFNAFLTSDVADLLLYNYFTANTIHSTELEEKLVKLFPSVFINAIRNNQVFLKEIRLKFLLSLNGDSRLHLHQKVWEWMYQTEKNLWFDVKNALKEISTENLATILIDSVFWLETMRFKDPSPEIILHFGSVYSLFLELLSSELPDKFQKPQDFESFDTLFYTSFFSRHKKNESFEANQTASLLDKISQWVVFRDQVLTTYSYDINFEPLVSDGNIYLNCSWDNNYKWQKNGVRYRVNEFNYFLKGGDVVEYLEERKQIKIGGKTEDDRRFNRSLGIQKFATLIILEDLGIESFSLHLMPGEPIPVLTILDPLADYSFNRRIRYERILQENSQTILDWKSAFFKVVEYSIRTNIFIVPYFLLSEYEDNKLNRESIHGLFKKSTPYITELFSYKPNKDQNFDRFNNRYDIWLKPLFKIGHFYFCPLGFLSNNAWFYAFAQSALTYRVIPFKNETSTVEKTVAERFALKGFPTKVITENDANSIDGDVDIIIEDHELTLLIQVKRSHFRVTLKEAHFETLFSVKKAAYQLVQAEKCLLEDNSIFKLKNKPIKWIVSSSFENIGEVYGGCRKVNYFELINAINNPNVRSLKDIISDVETDKNFNDFLNSQFDDSVPPEIRKYIAEISGPSKTGQNDVNHLLFRLEL